MTPLRIYSPATTVMKTRKEKCSHCGVTKRTPICPGCGKDMTYRSARVGVDIVNSKRSIHLRTHNMTCLKKALGKEAAAAVDLLLHAEGSQEVYGRRKRTPAVLKKMIKRAEKRLERVKMELLKAEGLKRGK